MATPQSRGQRIHDYLLQSGNVDVPLDVIQRVLDDDQALLYIYSPDGEPFKDGETNTYDVIPSPDLVDTVAKGRTYQNSRVISSKMLRCDVAFYSRPLIIDCDERNQRLLRMNIRDGFLTNWKVDLPINAIERVIYADDAFLYVYSPNGESLQAGQENKYQVLESYDLARTRSNEGSSGNSFVMCARTLRGDPPMSSYLGR